MTKQEIIAKIKALGLPTDSYILFGSCPLAAAGIREAKDIDLLVSPELFATLKKAGWRKVRKGPDDMPLVHDVFEAHQDWAFSHYNPTLEHLLKTANTIDGIAFASLSEVRKWKAVSEGSKHQADVELIDNFLRDNTNSNLPVAG